MKRKIRLFNKAYELIKNGLDIIELNVNTTSDMSTRFFQLKKAFDNLNREILKQLKKEKLDNEFKQIIKDI